MTNWKDCFADKDIFFVTPDVKRGIGLDESIPNYHIICLYEEPIIKVLRDQGVHIFCLQEADSEIDISKMNNTGSLLQHPKVTSYIQLYSKARPWIVYFKPSAKVDMLLNQMKYWGIGNKYEFGKSFEDKILFQKIASKIVPNHMMTLFIGNLNEISFSDAVQKFGLPIVVQFGFGWAGKSTFFIETESEYNQLALKYRFTTAKMSKKVKGFTVLNNCCIHNGDISIGPPAIQISGISNLYSKEFVTCGRQWPVNFLESSQVKEIYECSLAIGRAMSEFGYKGFFGLDFLIDGSSGEVFISETNARMTASSGFYTRLQLEAESIPLMALHFASFMDIKFNQTELLQPEISGSQLILRDEQLTPRCKLPMGFEHFIFENESVVQLENKYYPGRLKRGEYIFIKNRVQKYIKRGDELARVETKEPVLQSPAVLNEKLMKWLRLK